MQQGNGPPDWSTPKIRAESPLSLVVQTRPGCVALATRLLDSVIRVSVSVRSRVTPVGGASVSARRPRAPNASAFMHPHAVEERLERRPHVPGGDQGAILLDLLDGRCGAGAHRADQRIARRVA